MVCKDNCTIFAVLLNKRGFNPIDQENKAVNFLLYQAPTWIYHHMTYCETQDTRRVYIVLLSLHHEHESNISKTSS